MRTTNKNLLCTTGVARLVRMGWLNVSYFLSSANGLVVSSTNSQSFKCCSQHVWVWTLVDYSTFFWRFYFRHQPKVTESLSNYKIYHSNSMRQNDFFFRHHSQVANVCQDIAQSCEWDTDNDGTGEISEKLECKKWWWNQYRTKAMYHCITILLFLAHVPTITCEI